MNCTIEMCANLYFDQIKVQGEGTTFTDILTLILAFLATVSSAYLNYKKKYLKFRCCGKCFEYEENTVRENTKRNKNKIEDINFNIDDGKTIKTQIIEDMLKQKEYEREMNLSKKSNFKINDRYNEDRYIEEIIEVQEYDNNKSQLENNSNLGNDTLDMSKF